MSSKIVEITKISQKTYKNILVFVKMAMTKEKGGENTFLQLTDVKHILADDLRI